MLFNVFITCNSSLLSPLQVDPYSVAAKDGRIREGDQIVQVRVLALTYQVIPLAWTFLFCVGPYRLLVCVDSTKCKILKREPYKGFGANLL